jgi:hypothetical protein
MVSKNKDSSINNESSIAETISLNSAGFQLCDGKIIVLSSKAKIII